MDVKLVVTQGNQAGQEVPIPGRKFFIGRAEDCHLRPHSDLISRHHCVILVEEGFVAVRDFGSKNGTYVNGERITAEVELKPGDHLKVGQLEFEVRIDVGVGGKKLPKVHTVQEAAVRTVEKQKPRLETVGAKDDVDVSDWLDDDERATMSDTATIEPTRRMATTEEKTQTPAEEPAPEEPVPEEEPEETALDKAKSEASGSRDAATEGLKHLFRRF